VKRKRISDRKRAAIFALALGDVPYADAKMMTEDQILSLYHLDHNMLHAFEAEGGEHFSNYTPMLIQAHGEKTKGDIKKIAKSRRIRRKLQEHERKRLAKAYKQYRPYDLTGKIADALCSGFQEGARNAYDNIGRPSSAYADNYDRIDWNKKPKRKIRSRGFDKTRTRGYDGQVRTRKRKGENAC
jgi:hypothetical protein